jgi:hypothetical protein
MQPKRVLLASGAIAATVVASVCGVGLSTGMVRDHASDGAGELAPVIVPNPQPIDASTPTTAQRAPNASNLGSTADHRSTEEHEHRHDADD